MQDPSSNPTPSPVKPPPWSPPSPLPSLLETERLRIRPFDASEAEAMLAAINADRPSLLPWLPWAAIDNRSAAECTFHIERFRRARSASPPTDFAFGIFDAATGEVLGGTGFHKLDFEIAQGEIGYWIRGDRARRGLCTEAVAALITSGLTPQGQGGWGFRRITILCAEPNIASRRVPEKLGLRRELSTRGDRWVDGLGFVGTLSWGVLADEWDFEAKRALPRALETGRETR